MRGLARALTEPSLSLVSPRVPADRILLGTDKGALVIFDLSVPPPSTAATSSSPTHASPSLLPSATFVARHERFMPRQIDQLAVIKELNALVCLAGGDLTLHSLPDLSLLSSFAPQTKGAGSNFALHTEIRAAAQGAVPTIRTTLALACKRRLILLSWVDGTTWNPLVEVALPHQIRSMAFVDTQGGPASLAAAASGGPTKIVAGFSTGEYGVVTLPTPDLGGAIKSPVLGDLFSLPIPLGDRTTGTAAGASSSTRTGLATGLGGLRSLGGALGGALARKVDKNGVSKVPRVPRRSASRSQTATGSAADRPSGEDADDQDVVESWLWEKEWGWSGDSEPDRENSAGDGRGGGDGGEVLVVRDSEFRRIQRGSTGSCLLPLCFQTLSSHCSRTVSNVPPRPDSVLSSRTPPRSTKPLSLRPISFPSFPQVLLYILPALDPQLRRRRIDRISRLKSTPCPISRRSSPCPSLASLPPRPPPSQLPH